MAFNSSLQVFQKMDSMASELHSLRASEEKLRAERRSIFANLREVSQKLELSGPGKECDLSSVARALGELMADLGPQSDEAAENGAADGAVAVGPRSRPASSSTSVAPLARTACAAAAPDSAAAVAADGGAEVPPTPSSSPGSSSSAAVADDTDNCDTAGAQCAAGRAHRAHLPRQGLDDREEEEAEGPSESEVSTTPLSQKGAQFQTSFVMQCPRYWQADTSKCMVCAKAFGPFRRRHHCRSCGRNCCHQCSPFKVRLIAPLHQPLRPATDRPLMDAYRVCSDCHDEPLEGVGQE
mmetsp:Transcript_56816/g.163075  ORF Transcript_56816/g.163075 Transcript_56816/m.163075 type:complete len:296 (-) Transcript_56816:86-973(-)